MYPHVPLVHDVKSDIAGHTTLYNRTNMICGIGFRTLAGYSWHQNVAHTSTLCVFNDRAQPQKYLNVTLAYKVPVKPLHKPRPIRDGCLAISCGFR
jgi:hypothetical protein